MKSDKVSGRKLYRKWDKKFNYIFQLTYTANRYHEDRALSRDDLRIAGIKISQKQRYQSSHPISGNFYKITRGTEQR